jgi:hypothetical protein
MREGATTRYWNCSSEAATSNTALNETLSQHTGPHPSQWRMRPGFIFALQRKHDDENHTHSKK